MVGLDRPLKSEERGISGRVMSVIAELETTARRICKTLTRWGGHLDFLNIRAVLFL